MKTLIFPDDIDYQQSGYPPLRVDKIVESSVNNFFNSPVMDDYFERSELENPLQGYKKLSKVEEDLFDKISSFSNIEDISDEELINIFHTIQMWGGWEGRHIFVQDGGFEKNFDIETYRTLVSRCLNLEKHRLLDWVNTVSKWTFECNNGINRFKTSFSTKHVRFWLYNKLKDNTLPIFDLRIQNGFNKIQGNSLKNNKEEHLEFYWKQMIEKSKKEDITLKQLERLLFNYW
jgi:hypothetical protein